MFTSAPPSFVDLSHTIGHGSTTYPGLPPLNVADHVSREASHAKNDGQSSFHIAAIEMVSNTGTYMDVPFHRFENGGDLAALDLARVADVPGVLITCRDERVIDTPLIGDKDVRGKAVLFHTGWSSFFGTERYGDESPFLTAAAAELLRDAGAACVGIDACNIDDMTDKCRPVHTVLLGADIPIIEHLCNLHELADRTFTFFAVPPKIRAVGTFPVRAFARIHS